MTDRVYPSATKPNGTTTTTPAVAATNHHNPLPIPPAKAHLRHPYRQNPPQTARRRSHRTKRNYFCCCCCWSIFILIILLIATAIAGAIAYSIYKPHRPTFSFTSLKISQFNLTTASDDSTRLTTKLNITLSCTNPNKKLIFIYDPIQITTLTSSEVELGQGSFKSFTSNPKNITYIHTPLHTTSQVLDADSVTSLRSDLKKKSGLPLKILLDTKVVVKADNLKTKKLGIRIKCEGVHVTTPKGMELVYVKRNSNM
ncbi:Late embryogenesis abundant protein, LEA-14 [Heracleum sosnowskyi]|uniref:Late embryogenesis abundant protein, LEA-14 n=1 Tax=Heracleum sosnowskyi TaxID=360622 RepID=A0AAD8HIS7_9APIA|nr:Late embryogenesis abundant protein, LEA-14 [Heracleum sosnowskyi]